MKFPWWSTICATLQAAIKVAMAVGCRPLTFRLISWQMDAVDALTTEAIGRT